MKVVARSEQFRVEQSRLNVEAKLTQSALAVGVTFIPWRTGALGTMVGDGTNCVSAAWILSCAGIDAIS